jgi:hypothetical protein
MPVAGSARSAPVSDSRAVARKDFVVPCPMRVQRSMRAYIDQPASRSTRVVRLRAGEVVYLLSYIGEGTTAYWRNGQIVKTDTNGLTASACRRGGCWAEPLMKCSGDALQRPVKERWFRVRTTGGRSGWIRDGESLAWDEKC